MCIRDRLIPKPQSIKIQNVTHLFEDTINNNKITIQYVSSIPQALVNQKEAYHLTITPDSIFIKATADQGVYWAKQTLNPVSYTHLDDIVMMDTTILDKWTHVGKLPKPAAYGVSIRLSSNETLWIGGNTGNESLKNVYSVSLSLIHI